MPDSGHATEIRSWQRKPALLAIANSTRARSRSKSVHVQSRSAVRSAHRNCANRSPIKRSDQRGLSRKSAERRLFKRGRRRPEELRPTFAVALIDGVADLRPRSAIVEQCKPLAPGASVDSVEKRLCTTVHNFATHHINRKVVYPLGRLRSPPIIRAAFRRR